MEKNQLYMQLLEVMPAINPEGRRRRPHDERRRPEGGHPHGHREKGERQKERHDDLRMPGSARNILMILLEETKLNQRTLAKRMNISAQGVSDMIRKLEEKELIIRERGEAYNENIITLTAKGEEVAGKVAEKTKMHSENLFKDFSEEDVTKFAELLSKIHVNEDDMKHKDHEEHRGRHVHHEGCDNHREHPHGHPHGHPHADHEECCCGEQKGPKCCKKTRGSEE